MNLIFDRTQADVTYAAELNRKLGRGEALAPQELADWNAGLKGAYNASDMNRVDAAVRILGEQLTAAGYPVRYTSPIPQPEKPLTNFTLKSDDFQQAPYLYATGIHDTQYFDDYISTKAMISVAANQLIYVTANVALLQDSGFVWYDKNQQFISGAKSEAISTYSMSATPPQNAKYCNININSTGVTPNSIQVVNVIYSGTGDYIELSYIESTGLQYIDTGVKPTTETRMDINCQILEAYVGMKCLAGARNQASQTATLMYNLWYSGNTSLRTDYFGTIKTIDGVTPRGKMQISKDRNVTTVDGVSATNTAVSSRTCDRTLYIFNCNDANMNYQIKMRVDKLQLQDDDILKRDFIPAFQNGVVGLYDKIEGRMYPNSGTGDFIAGEVVTQPETPVEPDYTVIEKLSYAQTISSEPAMYHIDTGLSIKQGDTVNISLSYDILAADYDRECVLLSFPPAQSPPIIGRALIRNHGIRQKQFYLGGQISNYKTQVITSTHFGTYQNSIEEVYYSRHPEQFSTCTAQLIITSDKIYTLCAIGTNQLYKSEIPSIDFWSETERKILLLQEDPNNINENASYYRFKKLEIEINGEKHKFVPCKNENNKVGFLDEFDNSIVYNELGGVLLPGEVTETVKIPKPIFYLGDIINYDIWRTYLDNVKAIRDAYYTMPDTPKLPEPTAPLNFDGANAIEKLLYDVQVLYNSMLASYRKCGTFQAGTNTQRLPLQRSVT